MTHSLFFMILMINGKLVRDEGKRACLCTCFAPIFQVNHRADGFGTEPAAGDSPGEQRLAGDHRPSQRAIGRALRHRGHRDRRQGHKNLCKPKANELARFAEAPPSLSNQAQDEYQRLMNNKIVIQRMQCHACMSIAERERFIQITEI